jgi:SAM-dependent methyltransferase
VAAEVAFYDLAAQEPLLPVLFSQWYDYYQVVGLTVAERIGSPRCVLDVGCGIGVLTTFYAQQYPCSVFLGIDRSPASITAAQRKADELGLANVRFSVADLDSTTVPGPFDLIIATHVLLQSERDPGLPSRNWRTFERARDPVAQADFERRTGLGRRLDRLFEVLAPDGRMIVCEKTRHLGRRVPFQRALAARGLRLLERPLPIRYAIIEEITDDGPLYVLGRTEQAAIPWDESPEESHIRMDWSALATRAMEQKGFFYENHTAAAQQAWLQLPERHIRQETTREEADGRQVHVELGESLGLTYLYCANTFDQRQLVVVAPEQAGILLQYYAEVVQGLDATMETKA